MNYNLRFLILVFFLPIIISSCSSYKKVPYLQTGEEGVGEVDLTSFYREKVARFQPDDIIGITVNTVGEQSVAYDFNLPLQPTATPENSSEGNIDQGQGRQTYLVNKQGEIDFPVLGKIKVSGYTKEELEDYLKKSLRKFLKEDPIITIRLLNFKISVLGEVNRPGQFSVNKDRINVLEALALAGDMTIHGKRENVRIMRERPNGEIKIMQLDIASVDVVSSPNFYLQQNDIIYVEPNKAKAKSSDISSQTSILISIGSMLLTLVNLIVLITQ